MERRMTRRQIIQQLRLIVDAMRRMESKNISGLEAKPGFEESWSCWGQCAAWLREMQQEAERTQGPADPQKNA